MNFNNSISLLDFKAVAKKILELAEKQKATFDRFEYKDNQGNVTKRKLTIPNESELIEYFSIIYDSSFLKEEGRNIKCNIIIGNVKSIQRSILLNCSDYEFLDLKCSDNSFCSENIRKIAPIADNHKYAIVASNEEQDLTISGLLYIPSDSTPKVLSVDRDFSEEDFLIPRNCDGLTFTILGEGRIKIYFGSLLASIKKGKLFFKDIEDKQRQDKSIDLIQELIGLKDVKKKMTLANLLFKSLSAIEDDGHGGTIIYVKNENSIKKAGIKENFIANRPLELDKLHPTNWGSSEYSFHSKRFVDLLSSFSKVDGAVLASVGKVIGFGAKLPVEDITDDEDKKKNYPSIMQKKGLRHWSAFSLVQKHGDDFIAFVVSADGGIIVIFNDNKQDKTIPRVEKLG